MKAHGYSWVNPQLCSHRLTQFITSTFFSRISQKVSYDVEKVIMSYRKMIFWNQFSSFAQYEKLSYRGCKCNSTSGPQKLSYRKIG
jgi:hypothetical protein